MKKTFVGPTYMAILLVMEAIFTDDIYRSLANEKGISQSRELTNPVFHRH